VRNVPSGTARAPGGSGRAHPYKRDIKNLEFHLLDTGHFVLTDEADALFPLIHDFLDCKVAGA
jgi:hypothetical protein